MPMHQEPPPVPLDVDPDPGPPPPPIAPLPQVGKHERNRRLALLSAIESSLNAHRQLIPTRFSLDFSSVPPTHKISDPPPEPVGTAQQNGLYQTIRGKIREQRKSLGQLDPVGDTDLDRRLDTLIERSDSCLQLLDQLRDDAWTTFVLFRYLDSTSSDKGPVPIKPAPVPGLKVKTMQPWIAALLVVVTVMHALAQAAQVDITFLLAGIKAVLYGALLWSNVSLGMPPSLTDAQSELLKSLPADIRAILRNLELEPAIIRYAVCPKCRATYAPNSKKPEDAYPRRCTFRETDKPVCGEPLVVRREIREGKRVRYKYDPIRFFPYRSMHSWLAEIFQRLELAALARDAWKSSVPQGARWKDIWDAPGLRNFLGPDGKTPFSVQPEGSIHLVFSLFIDWFNPYGNKKAGKSHSVGAIFLAPTSRGSTSSTTFFHPLIDDLLVLWHRGIFLSETALEQASLLVRAAVIPLVCDLPALRKAAGFAGHRSEKYFCSFCQLPRSQVKDLRQSQWPQRTRAKHQCYADEWKNAETEADRDAAFKKHGVRWSELLRLPYWDPTRFALVDAMHNLFLGDLQHHCREFWGIDIKDKSSDSSKATPHTPEEQATWLQNVVAYLKLSEGAEKKLKRVRKGYLAAVAELNGAVPPAAGWTKQDYIDALLAWWTENAENEIRLPPVFEESTRDFRLQRDRYDISKFRILDQDTLSSIREDILNTIVPSWMQRVPKNFGSPSHGKLKADQWRTGCLVNLVITLVRLWGVPTATPRQKMLLENFLDLVRASDLATRRTMDESRAEKFDNYMRRYLAGLVDTFKHPLVPNHHLSLHLRECLELFGPVHAWWAFPFERFNGILQHLNTNSRTNDMPLTFIRYFYIGANLRWLMATSRWPEDDYFKEMMEAYKKTFRDAARSNPRLASFRPTGSEPALDVTFSEEAATDLPRDMYRALLARVNALRGPLFSSVFDLRDRLPGLPTAVNSVASFDYGGIRFGTKTSQMRNSFIVFNSPDSSSPRAGQIRQIFTHLRTENGKRVVEPFFVVDEYVELQQRHARLDPYRQFEDLETRLCYNRFTAKPHVLALQDIQAHFAALTYTPTDIR